MPTITNATEKDWQEVARELLSLMVGAIQAIWNSPEERVRLPARKWAMFVRQHFQDYYQQPSGWHRLYMNYPNTWAMYTNVLTLDDDFESERKQHRHDLEELRNIVPKNMAA